MKYPALAPNIDYILPGYPTRLAPIQFGNTGSTQIGKWVFNRSFMLPGLAAIDTAIPFGFLLVQWLL